VNKQEFITSSWRSNQGYKETFQPKLNVAKREGRNLKR